MVWRTAILVILAIRESYPSRAWGNSRSVLWHLERVAYQCMVSYQSAREIVRRWFVDSIYASETRTRRADSQSVTNCQVSGQMFPHGGGLRHFRPWQADASWCEAIGERWDNAQAYAAAAVLAGGWILLIRTHTSTPA